MNRLLSKLRQGDRHEKTNGAGPRPVRVVANGRPRSRSPYVLTAAEIAPCTCPDFCERDHANE